MKEPRESLPTHELVRPAKHFGYDSRDRYAKLQSDWEENAGDPRALCKLCKRDGTGEAGDPFYVFLPKRCTEQEVYRDDGYAEGIVCWRYDVEGTRIGRLGPDLVWRIELDTNLTPGGSAYAWPLQRNGQPDTDPDTRIQVHELLNKHSGWGRIEGYHRGAWGFVKGCLGSDHWEILDLEQMAHQICVTLTEDIAYNESQGSEAQTAECTLDDFYRGTDPTLIHFAGSLRGPLKVKDPQNLFPRALSGAKAEATWDNLSQEYHLVECQQMATLIKCTVDADAGPGDTISVESAIDIMQPITGQTPIDANAAHDPSVMGINNTFAEAVSSGVTLIAGWNEELDRWEVVEVVRRGARHVKAVSDWVDGNGDPHVSCRHSSRAGSVLDGSETPFDVYLAIRVPGGGSPADYKIQQTPNILQNDVFKYTLDESGVPAGLDYLDDARLTIKQFSGDLSGIPAGWALCDGTANASPNGDGTDLSGKFVVGYDSGDTDFNAIGKKGWPVGTDGRKDHGPGLTPTGHDIVDNPLRGHYDHSLESGEAEAGAGFEIAATPLTHSSHPEANHLPPYWTTAFIQRIVPF